MFVIYIIDLLVVQQTKCLTKIAGLFENEGKPETLKVRL